MSRTLDDVILYPDDIEDEKLSQFKCMECGCVNTLWKDLPGYGKLLHKGSGLRKIPGCARLDCHCHTGRHPLPRIITREVTLLQAFGVPNGE